MSHPFQTASDVRKAAQADGCHIGSCKRHRTCMYMPCRSGKVAPGSDSPDIVVKQRKNFDMRLNQKASMMIRTLMRDHGVQDHIVFPTAEGEGPFSSGTILAALEEDPMKTMLRQMFTGWILQEASYEREGNHMRATRSPEDAMAEACGGDERLGQLLVLFGHWSNDVTSIAAHYGLTLARRQPDGTLLHPDGTVDTLMKGGTLEIVEIEPAPSPEHWWHKGRWNAPEPDQSGEELG